MNDMTTTLKMIESLKEKKAYHKKQARMLQDEYSRIMKQSREHTSQANKITNECIKIEREYEDRLIKKIKADTDFAALRQPDTLKGIMKDYIKNPDLPYSNMGREEFILYAILRGKPWHSGLSPHTRFHGSEHEHMKYLRNSCAHRLASIIANGIIKRYQEQIPKDRGGNLSWRVRRQIIQVVKGTLPLQAMCEAHIPDDSQFNGLGGGA